MEEEETEQVNGNQCLILVRSSYRATGTDRDDA
jgi:hypothetical protein